MSKIVLISCNTTEEPYPVYPLGMSLVANAARELGHDVAQLDLYVEENPENILKTIKNISPFVIGLSLRNVDNVNISSKESYINQYKTFVQEIRKISSAYIVLGGSAYTIFPEKLLEETGADYGIKGEGENVFCELVSSLEKGEKIPENILNNDKPEKDFGSFKRNRTLADFYLKKGGMLNIQTKRGCPHKCLYCSYPTLEGRRYRFRAPESVADEIEYLIKEYNADWLSITDSVFNDASGKYLEIAEEIIRKNIKIPWMCFLRPDNFTEEQVDILKRAGLTSVEWGTDCSTDTTLKAMQKDFTWDKVVHSNNLFSSSGIASSHFIIFGGPDETEETAQEGLGNISTLNNCVVFSSIGIRVLPNTPVCSYLVKNNLIDKEQELLNPYFYISPDIEYNKLDTMIKDSFKDRTDRIYNGDENTDYVERAKAFHLFGYRGPVWDYILKKGKNMRKRK